MKTWVRNTLRAGVLAAGFLLFAASPAHAGGQDSSFNSGIASGNNVSVPIAVAANVCGNGVGVLGVGLGSSGVCAASAHNESAGGGQDSSFNSGIASGNNVSVPVAVAGNLCGNGVGVAGLGIGTSGACVAKAKNESGGAEHGYEKAGPEYRSMDASAGGGQTSMFNSGILSGNNISVPIALAVNACGNGVGVLGAGIGSSGVCVAKAKNEAAAGDGQTSAYNSGIASGNNIEIPIAGALNVCGNGVGVLGAGIGSSGVCVAKATNDGDGRKKHHKGYKKSDETSKASENERAANNEARPALSTPLPAPDLTDTVNTLTSPLGTSSGLNAPDVQLPATGNSLGLPV